MPLLCLMSFMLQKPVGIILDIASIISLFLFLCHIIFHLGMYYTLLIYSTVDGYLFAVIDHCE